jgi:hypothetical protein
MSEDEGRGNELVATTKDYGKPRVYMAIPVPDTFFGKSFTSAIALANR